MENGKCEMVNGTAPSTIFHFPSSISHPLGAAFEERAQLAAPRGVTELPQRLRLDLPYALARDREALADFLERVLAAVADAEPHLDHLLFARGQRLEHRFGLFLQIQVDHR